MIFKNLMGQTTIQTRRRRKKKHHKIKKIKTILRMINFP